MTEQQRTMLWNKTPVMIYVYPEMFENIEKARGTTRRSTFIEGILKDALMPERKEVI